MEKVSFLLHKPQISSLRMTLKNLVGNRRLEADIESPTKRHKTAVVLDIYGRRIDMQQLKPDPSLYSLARAWIHSDIVPHNIFSTKSNQVGSDLPPPAPCIIGEKSKNPNVLFSMSTTSEDLINSLPNVDHNTILVHHIAAFKEARKLSKMRSQFRLQRYLHRLSKLPWKETPIELASPEMTTQTNQSTN